MDLDHWGHSLLPWWKLEASSISSFLEGLGLGEGAEAGFLQLLSSPSQYRSYSWIWKIEQSALEIPAFTNGKEMHKYRKYASTKDHPQNTFLCGARGFWMSNTQSETLEDTYSF